MQSLIWIHLCSNVGCGHSDIGVHMNQQRLQNKIKRDLPQIHNIHRYPVESALLSKFIKASLIAESDAITNWNWITQTPRTQMGKSNKVWMPEHQISMRQRHSLCGRILILWWWWWWRNDSFYNHYEMTKSKSHLSIILTIFFTRASSSYFYFIISLYITISNQLPERWQYNNFLLGKYTNCWCYYGRYCEGDLATTGRERNSYAHLLEFEFRWR